MAKLQPLNIHLALPSGSDALNNKTACGLECYTKSGDFAVEFSFFERLVSCEQCLQVVAIRGPRCPTELP